MFMLRAYGKNESSIYLVLAVKLRRKRFTQRRKERRLGAMPNFATSFIFAPLREKNSSDLVSLDQYA